MCVPSKDCVHRRFNVYIFSKIILKYNEGYGLILEMSCQFLMREREREWERDEKNKFLTSNENKVADRFNDKMPYGDFNSTCIWALNFQSDDKSFRR